MAAELTLTDFALVVMVAAVALLVVRWFRQPMVLGYLVAGLLVGPSGPLPVRVSPESVETLSLLGIVFIMMSLGLEFSPKKLREIGAAPVGVALVQMVLSFMAARLVAHLVGFDGTEALFIAAALSISSTIVVIKVLDERAEIGAPHGRLAIGILLVQDIAAIGFLGVVEGASVTGSLRFDTATPILLGLVLFTLAALVLGALLAPRILHSAARGPSELLLIVILGILFAVTLLAEHFGFSIALGAFLVGAVIAETRIVDAAERMIEPLKHLFTAVFFVSIGMLIAPGELIDQWALVALFSTVVIVSRLIGVALPAFLFGSPPQTAVRSGASIAQIGEFSFIVVASGVALGFVTSSLFAVFVGVAAVTTLLTPYVVRASGLFVSGGAVLTPAPLRTYARLYTGWVQRLGDTEETRRHRSTESTLVRRVGLNLVALAVIAGLVLLADRILTGLTIGPDVLRVPAVWAVWPVAGVVAVPFLITIWVSLRQLVGEIVLEFVPDHVLDQPEPPIALKVVRASLSLVLAVGVGALILAFLPAAGAEARVIIPVVLLIVLIAGVVFWRRITSMHAHVEGTIENLFGVSRTAEERDEVLRLIGRHYTVSLETEGVYVPEGSPVAHHQIRDTAIRNRTGATIVSIERGHERYVNPPPSLLILPNDRLLLMGETHHLEKARNWITSRHAVQGEGPMTDASLTAPVAVREIVLRDDAACAGRSIAEIELRRRTGASLVAALRGHDHIQNPTPNFMLQGGDRLFLLGTDDQLDAAERLLREPAVGPEGPGAEADRPLGTSDGHPAG